MTGLKVDQLAASLIDGFNQGHAVMQGKADPENQDSIAVLTAPAISEAARNDTLAFFQQTADGLSLIEGLGKLIAERKDIAPVEEFLYDLLMIKLMQEWEEEEGEEDDELAYLESPEWEEIESAAMDNGSELLNVLVYLKNCKNFGDEPDIEHFLHDFLLVDEDAFQDEFFIYEDLIKQQELVDAHPKQVMEIGAKIEDPDMEILFVPLMIFFREDGRDYERWVKILMKYAPQPDVHTAVYSVMHRFFTSE